MNQPIVCFGWLTNLQLGFGGSFRWTRIGIGSKSSIFEPQNSQKESRSLFWPMGCGDLLKGWDSVSSICGPRALFIPICFVRLVKSCDMIQVAIVAMFTLHDRQHLSWTNQKYIVYPAYHPMFCSGFNHHECHCWSRSCWPISASEDEVDQGSRNDRQAGDWSQ